MSLPQFSSILLLLLTIVSDILTTQLPLIHESLQLSIDSDFDEVPKTPNQSSSTNTSTLSTVTPTFVLLRSLIFNLFVQLRSAAVLRLIHSFVPQTTQDSRDARHPFCATHTLNTPGMSETATIRFNATFTSSHAASALASINASMGSTMMKTTMGRGAFGAEYDLSRHSSLHTDCRGHPSFFNKATLFLIYGHSLFDALKTEKDSTSTTTTSHPLPQTPQPPSFPPTTTSDASSTAVPETSIESSYERLRLLWEPIVIASSEATAFMTVCFK